MGTGPRSRIFLSRWSMRGSATGIGRKKSSPRSSTPADGAQTDQHEEQATSTDSNGSSADAALADGANRADASAAQVSVVAAVKAAVKEFADRVGEGEIDCDDDLALDDGVNRISKAFKVKKSSVKRELKAELAKLFAANPAADS